LFNNAIDPLWFEFDKIIQNGRPKILRRYVSPKQGRGRAPGPHGQGLGPEPGPGLIWFGLGPITLSTNITILFQSYACAGPKWITTDLTIRVVSFLGNPVLALAAKPPTPWDHQVRRNLCLSAFFLVSCSPLNCHFGHPYPSGETAGSAKGTCGHAIISKNDALFELETKPPNPLPRRATWQVVSTEKKNHSALMYSLGHVI